MTTQSGPIARVFRDRSAKTENSARYSLPLVVYPRLIFIFALSVSSSLAAVRYSRVFRDRFA